MLKVIAWWRLICEIFEGQLLAMFWIHFSFKHFSINKVERISSKLPSYSEHSWFNQFKTFVLGFPHNTKFVNCGIKNNKAFPFPVYVIYSPFQQLSWFLPRA